uniref:Protein kinase domain-containing protein n=1 Tax=Ananas comosus var. bracteatus TaxID=296719 RepID=A0A6V7PK25_ANACO|nr:unnamed protein product [Ananas comosus var. bracteatus]
MDDDTSFAVVVALSAALVIALLIVALLAAAAAAAVLRRRRVSAAGEGAAAEEEKEGEIRRGAAEGSGGGGRSRSSWSCCGASATPTSCASSPTATIAYSNNHVHAPIFGTLNVRYFRPPSIIGGGGSGVGVRPERHPPRAPPLPAASAAPLPWAARTRILYDVAGALAHLHSASASASGAVVVVHGDVTSSNVLLGPLPRLRPLLCDFGSARLGFSASLSPSPSLSVAVASPGYADPFFLRTGILSKSSDVYAFGVLLLETLTGRPAVGSDGRNLTAEIAPAIAAPPAEGLLDPRLRGRPGFDAAAAEAEAAAAAEIAARCVGAQPSLRPSMAEVRALIRERMPSAISAADPGSDGEKKMAEP